MERNDNTNQGVNMHDPTFELARRHGEQARFEKEDEEDKHMKIIKARCQAIGPAHILSRQQKIQLFEDALKASDNLAGKLVNKLQDGLEFWELLRIFGAAFGNYHPELAPIKKYLDAHKCEDDF